MYTPNSMWTWSFTIVATLQAIIAIGLESYVFGKFQSSLKGNAEATTQSRTIPTYLSVFIFGFLYQLLLVWDALRLKNTIQVIGLCLYNVGILVYAAIQMDQIDDAVDYLATHGNQIDAEFWQDVKPFLIAIPCVMALGTILLSFIAWKLYDEFAWTIYKHISADLRLKRRYLTYQIYIALLKFDFFFFLGFTVQFLVIVVNTTDVEFYLTIAAVPITIALLLLAGWFTRKENIAGMVAIIIIYFGALAYFLFKLIRMYKVGDDRVLDYLPARRNLSSFAVITILLLIATIVLACMCTHNFGKGLKPHVTRRKVPDVEDMKFGQNELGPVQGQVPSRMTID
ncbi:hypothetical protein M501DRAFT_1016375 [Patellaria atrata CBS 101060]|uniref:Uncharacterized protein n=1 Tax=Patellaria atrata CBS 101060 TaxID=1346257 RepID=A0A9P4VPZ3_9PEZI|nr:hypothetical protein M501DRAFT_1016375 [Patellaria atrata CBS 101060]